MATPSLPTEVRAEVVRLKATGLTHREIAEKLGIAEGSVSKSLAMAGSLPEPTTETSEIAGDQWKISLPKTRICTLEQLIEYCKIDLEVWEVERFVCNKWEVGMGQKAFTELFQTKDGRDIPMWQRDQDKIEPIILPLFQVKAFLKKRKGVNELKDILERLIKKAEKHAPTYPKIPKIPAKSGNAVELSPVDVHHGALIWGKETGGHDWDLKISERDYKTAFLSLISRTDDFKPERALMVLGHDQQNADNRAGLTEAGTPQNNDGRFQKVAEVSLNCSLWAIDTCLQRYGNVEVFMVPGNHDYLATWQLGRILQAWYRNVPQVKIENSPNPRKYWEYGINMLLLTHGNKGKLERYPGVMASEQAAMWGRTKWHEAHTGDKHQRRLIELDGATVRILPSLRPPCSWTAENMFLGSIRAAEAYVWNKSEGLVGTACYSILNQ